jgi:hypothetical protein
MMNKGLESTGPDLIYFASSVGAARGGANIVDQIKSGDLSIPAIVLFAVLGIFTLYIAYKIGRFVLKIFCIIIGLAAIVGAISWFLLRH